MSRASIKFEGREWFIVDAFLKTSHGETTATFAGSRAVGRSSCDGAIANPITACNGPRLLVGALNMTKYAIALGLALLSGAALSQTSPSASPIIATAVPAAPTTVIATPAALVAARVEAPTAGRAVLPANSEVMLRLDEEVSSKRKRVGDTFKLSVLQDVMLGNFVVIPRGTPASGSVTFRTGKGAFGKSAKMEVTIGSINLNGRPIPLTGNFRQEGEGNTGATVGTAVAVGPFAAFVTGRSAVFQSGREFRVATREAMPVILPQ